MDWVLLADIILALHVCLALFLALGLPVIWVGALLKKQFVRNRRFRLVHAGLMGFVTFESVVGMICPLTVWENELRRMGGGSPHGDSFMGYWLNRILYHDVEPWVFGVTYCLFFAAIIATFFMVPMNRRPEKTAD